MTSPVSVTPSSSTVTTELVENTGMNAALSLSSEGDTGIQVERLQANLRRLGYGDEELKRTGTFDEQTKKAVLRFQEKNGLEPTGAYDKPTRKAMIKETSTRMPLEGPFLREGRRGAVVKHLEQKLKERGLLEGEADAFFDAKTAKAVMKLEKELGVKVDGKVGRFLWRELGGAGEGSGRQLKLGDKGIAVQAMQRRMRQLGYYEGEPHGKFDAATERAVKEFAAKNQLKSEGVVTAKVWDALRIHVVADVKVGGPALKAGQQGPAVATLQKALARRGLYKGQPSGEFDKNTVEAVKRFQARQKLKVDGAVTNEIWQKLGGAGGGSGPRLKVGADNTAAVSVLQRRLTELGFEPGPVDGDFGKMTEAAVNAYKKANGLTPDGIVGQRLWSKLGVHVVNNPRTDPSDAPEPAHNYRRVRVDNGWLNVRTEQMFKLAHQYAREMGVEKPFYLVQGSYSNGVSASAGTHDGGGALDIRTYDHSREDVVKMVKALRMAGFAAWKRGYGGDSFDPHIHAIAIGDRELSSGARNQVREFFAGGDGLVGSAPDGDRAIGRPVPNWANKYR